MQMTPVAMDTAADVPLRQGRRAPGGARPLRVLTVTTLYPSSVNPRHGIFVETRLRKLLEAAPVDVRVIAPVPWFPSSAEAFGRYAQFAEIPQRENRHGIVVRHPRYFTIPKIAMRLQPLSLARAIELAAIGLAREGWRFDVIDAHYFYPDGVAAALVARRLARPVVVTARGSDINLIAKLPRPARVIRAAAAQAARVIAVSGALRDEMVKLGIDAGHIEVIRNGVDTGVFHPRDHAEARSALGFGPGPVVASVGNLVPEKGHDLVLEAAARLGGVEVAIVGTGPEKTRLQALATTRGIAGRTRFLDNMPQDRLAVVYAAADVLALGSTREGWPNVLLEAMACGTPVVATDVGGVAEIIGGEVCGARVKTRDPQDFAAALRAVIDRRLDRAALTAYAARFDWHSVAWRHYEVLAEAAVLARGATDG